MDQALFLLKFRDRSVEEMARRLGEKRFAPDVVARVLARLTELGLLNDAALARGLTETRRRAGQGDLRVRRDLLRRGLPRDKVDAALATPSEEPSADRLRRILEKKRAAYARLDRATAYRRAFGALARQGFEPDDIRPVLRDFFTKSNEGENDHDSDL